MRDSICFFVQGEPKGQPRPRAFAFRGKAHVFNPGTAEGWKGQIAATAKNVNAIPFEPWEGPIMLSLAFSMPRPKAHFRTGKNAGQLKPDAPHWHTGKPDCDNLAKAVMDTLTTLGFWKDDQQVSKLLVWKAYAEGPGCGIIIKETVDE